MGRTRGKEGRGVRGGQEDSREELRRIRGRVGGGKEEERKRRSWGMSGEGGEGVGGVRGGGFGGGQEKEEKLRRMRWRSKKRQKTIRIPAETQWLPWGATG